VTNDEQRDWGSDDNPENPVILRIEVQTVFSERRETSDEQREAPASDLLREAVAYFRSQPGLRRYLEGLAAKYRSLGRLGGVIELPEVGGEERTALEGLLRRRLPDRNLRLAAADFQAALAGTRFETLEPVALLAAWQGRELLTRREQRAVAEQARQTALQSLMAEFPHPFCRSWLQAALDKMPQTRLAQRADAGDSDFAANMAIALRALSALPAVYQRLPLFAVQICGDPHGLDPGRAAGKLFLEGLRFCRTLQGEKTAGDESMGSPVEALNELFYGVKLLRDDLLNFATCYGLAAFAAGRELAYWRQAALVGAPLNVPLRELIRITELQPAARLNCNVARCEGYPVFVVENSGVFSTLLDGKGKTGPPLVCLHGQFKLASWALLDRLTASGAFLRYSGDFDPEGLQMAQKLLLRYPGRAEVWRMSVADYLEAVPGVNLDQTRLQKLQSIRVPQLQLLAREIASRRLAAYQEGILTALAVDLEAG
jgi:uncharacterized protein (TIGR02679 family)